MAKFGGFQDEEEDVLASKEPQVSSQDPEERKAARSLRIKKRQEALKRAEQPPEEIAAEEEPTLIEQATATAAEELQRLSLDGAAKVTNVKVTTDEREVERRAAYFEEMRINLDKIEAEANEAQLEYEIITANWDEMLKIKDPLDIEVSIQDQRKKCDILMEQKNELIVHLKDDLKKMDDGYYEDLDKQDKEIKELSERIEKQVTIMQRAYEKQLSLIEKAIMIEREMMLEHNNKRWDALYKQRDKEEVAHMDYKFEHLEEHKQEMEAIMWDHNEKYREAKIELETLIQELQRELEKLKATCIINTEKIGYTYQVLKKREEENVFVRSQQKRKLNKMADVSNALRAKIRKAADDGAAEELRADTEIVKLMAAMDDLEKKCYHFSHVNDYKFSQVWRMSAARCVELSRELRRAEVALHAHVLAEPAPPPPPPPPASPLAAKEDAVKSENTGSSTTFDENIAIECGSKDRLVRHILDLVADNTGFLVEDRLLMLIEKYPVTSRNLCTLDAIFMALEIQAEEDIALLCETFMNYAFCPVCVGMDMGSDIIEPTVEDGSLDDDVRIARRVSNSIKGSRGDRSPSIRPRTSIARSMSISTSRSIHLGFRCQEMTPSDQQLIIEADEIMLKCGDPQGVVMACGAAEAGLSSRRARGVTVADKPQRTVKPVNPYLCPVGHLLEIEPMQVLTALGEFIAVFVPPEKKKLYDILDGVKPPDFSSPSRKIQPADIEQYWAQWRTVFPPEKDRFWDGLLAGLNDYLHVLQERDRLNEEVVALRHRNSSLRRLVRGALPPATAAPSAPRNTRLAPSAPRYTRPAPSAFTAPKPDITPAPKHILPPI